MNKIYSTIITFTTLFLFNYWVFDRTGNAAIGMITFNAAWEYIPLYGITIGTLVSLVGLWVFDEASKSSPHMVEAKSWLDKVPLPWIDHKDLSKRHEKFLKLFVIFLVLAFPLMANIHFWLRLNSWNAWDNCGTTPGEPIVKIWEYPTASFNAQCDFWDAHRYGNYEKRSLDGHGGTSFVPLVEPSISIVLSIWLFIYATRVSLRVFATQSNGEQNESK